ncbi:MAG: methyltransferase domain-containing protein [Candidatus Lindowbacteria bacterium]|nr:methyltransferase domain-containing protein [Candidatus Lindowbacteria bacterium]
MKFHLISFNKVLEHVTDPVADLKRSLEWLEEDGCVYIEVPDGKNAHGVLDVINREEFFIEHFTVFTKKSVNYLAEQAGLDRVELEEIHEPSDKYTIYTFLKPKVT